MNAPADRPPTVLRYGRGRSVIAALVLVAVAVGGWWLIGLTLSQGGTDWPIMALTGAFVLVITAWTLNGVAMAIGPNQITLARDRLTIHRGLESVSVPWAAITQLEDQRARVNGVLTQFLVIHVRQGSDIEYRGLGRILSRLGRSSSPTIQIPLRSGVPLLDRYGPEEAADLIAQFLAAYQDGSHVGT